MANFLAVAASSSPSKMNAQNAAFNMAAATAAAKLAHLFPLTVSASNNPFSIESLLSSSSSSPQSSLNHNLSAASDTDNNNTNKQSSSPSLSLKQHSPSGHKNQAANSLLLSMKQHQQQINNNYSPSTSTASPVDIYGILISITYHKHLFFL